MLSVKEEAGTDLRTSSQTKHWSWEEDGSTNEEKMELGGFSVKLVIHHYADPSCSKKLQKVTE